MKSSRRDTFIGVGIYFILSFFGKIIIPKQICIPTPVDVSPQNLLPRSQVLLRCLGLLKITFQDAQRLCFAQKLCRLISIEIPSTSKNSYKTTIYEKILKPIGTNQFYAHNTSICYITRRYYRRTIIFAKIIFCEESKTVICFEIKQRQQTYWRKHNLQSLANPAVKAVDLVAQSKMFLEARYSCQ